MKHEGIAINGVVIADLCSEPIEQYLVRRIFQNVDIYHFFGVFQQALTVRAQVLQVYLFTNFEIAFCYFIQRFNS